MALAEPIDRAGLLREAQLGPDLATGIQAHGRQRRQVTQLRGERRVRVEERLQGIFPEVEQRRVEVTAQPLPGVGELPDRLQSVLADLGRDRLPGSREPGAEVVEQTEADIPRRILAVLAGCPLRAGPHPAAGSHLSPSGRGAAASTTLAASAT